MFFEDEINRYYKYNFEMIDINQYAFQIIIIWTLFKIIFYICPIFILLNNNKEQIKNNGKTISNIKKLSVKIIILSILIPLLDCFVFFYIVVSLIPRVKGLYKKQK
jgi:hypothetical protein